MSIRRSLFLSVALIVPWLGGVAAAEPAPRFPSWYFATEGSVLSAAPSVSTQNVDGSSATAAFGTNLGGFGAATLGSSIDADRDWRIRLGYAGFNNTTHTDAANTDPRQLTSQLFATSADFDLGFKRTLAANEFRAFAGLRTLAVSQSATEDKVGAPPPDSVLSTEFIGAGPRAGVSLAHALADSPWGVSASVAGSAVFGYRSVVGKNTSSVTSSAATIFNAEAAIGLDYRASQASQFTIGVRGEQWWNIRPGYSSDALTVKSDLSDWGPFVRWTFHAP